jgi:acetylornithine/succinyldiaminopimelate/putrescine aminotransferase
VTCARLSAYASSVNPYRVELFDALGWTEEMTRAEGAWMEGAGGQRYLDMCCGFGASALGHNHPAITEAATATLAAKRPATVPLGVPAEVGELARSLCLVAGAGLRKAYFANSGAEGIEAALKLAMIRTGRARFVSFEGGYHGLTLGALGVMGGGEWRAPLPQLAATSRVVPFGDLDAVEAALATGEVAAVITEVVQGAGGGRAWTGEALLALASLCRRHGALLVLDEVLTGIGRTGAWFAFQAVAPGLMPDVVVASKGLTGGIAPFAAVLTTDDVFDAAFAPPGRAFVHGSTFSGYALGVAIARAAIGVVDREGLLARATDAGARLTEGLRALERDGLGVTDVRGRGLLVFARVSDGEDLDDPSVANACAQVLRARGVIVALAAHAPAYVKLTPPLTITDAEIDHFLGALRGAIEELHEAA